MRVARIEAIRLFPKAVKEAWTEDAYVWPSTMPCVLVKVSAEDGTNINEIWYKRVL